MRIAAKSRRILVTASVLAAALSVAVAQILPVQAAVSVSVGSRNFTEEQIAGYLYADLLKAHGYSSSVNEGFTTESEILSALEGGSVQVVPDYLGNGLVDLNKVYKPGTSLQSVLNTVNKGLKSHGVKLLTPSAKFNDQNVFVTTQKISKKYGLKTMSDLARLAPKLSIEVLQECTTRLDCLKGFDKVYHPKKFKKTADPVGGNSGPFYADLLNGSFDVVQGYGRTDPQISQDHLVPLKDDKGLFPPDNMTPFVNATFASKHASLAKWLNKLDSLLTNKNFAHMDALGYGGEPVQEVADNFLKANKLT